MEHVITFFETIRWKDLVDIIVNSYILFRLYALFRGTAVFRVLIVIAFLWFIQRMAVSMELIVTSWILQGITAAVALLIIVIFRNEIRSVLQAKNLKALFWGMPKRSQETPVDIMVETIYEMARRHIGALLVLPGKDDLDEFIHSGIEWGGMISREMILTIFWHDNPVHDGAVLIQGNRVAEVGAVLPLSHREDFPLHYGTRHRAAAGLAENTDALVITVSEERGSVSAAKGDRIWGVGGKKELEHLLVEHIGGSEKGERTSLKGKLEPGIAAVLSVLLISGVWFSFTRGFETFVMLEVPIEYRNRNSRMEILDTSVDAVRLHLIGSGPLIKSIRPEQVRIRLDLGSIAAGSNSLTITQEQISLPPGVTLKRIEPQNVDVTLDVIKKMVLPIQVDWIGTLPEPLILSKAETLPDRIDVIGPAGVLDNISTIYTEKVPLEGIVKTGEMTVKLVLPESLKTPPESPDRIKIKYVVKQRVK
ncbi:MAG: diadenylate cyclase [Thermodesulfobacteriota bacterium]|nr:diadenylate cyclase [Thermodesulfobacteriota bacterium]